MKKLFLIFSLVALNAYADLFPMIINGKEANPSEWPQVVLLTNQASQKCTGTLVGPQTILTAAHCSPPDGTVNFSINGKSFTAKITRSSLFPGKPHDIAAGFVNEVVQGVKPAIIGGTLDNGTLITLLGFGCTQEGGGTSDGKLRIGDSQVIGFKDFSAVSRKENGAALCFGDSGGPAYTNVSSKLRLVAVNSAGNIKDTNQSVRLDIPETKTFLNEYISKNGNTKICGINDACEQEDPLPSCTMTASPNPAIVGDSVKVELKSENATEAQIKGQSVQVPIGFINIPADSNGTFQVDGKVKSASGKTATCQVTYVVNKKPDPGDPECKLTATPKKVRVGEPVTLFMRTKGPVTSATIDGTTVSFPEGQITVKKNQKGNYTGTGVVMGNGKQVQCFDDYQVVDDILPPINNFAVTPVFCGENAIPGSFIQKICIGEVQKESALTELKINKALVLFTADNNYEVLPVIARKDRPDSPGPSFRKEEWHLYANRSNQGPGYPVLDAKLAILTNKLTLEALVPWKMEGRSTNGKYFYVEKFNAYAVSHKPIEFRLD